MKAAIVLLAATAAPIPPVEVVFPDKDAQEIAAAIEGGCIAREWPVRKPEDASLECVHTSFTIDDGKGQAEGVVRFMIADGTTTFLSRFTATSGQKSMEAWGTNTAEICAMIAESGGACRTPD